ncbi:MAG: hypothetical protein PHC92_03390 [Syntrophomonadaceae bacterium]|nr:hypothetical protein [Syntrophomonadaceae bacterium]
MWKKSIYLLLIFAAFYTNLMINYPSDRLKSLGYEQALNWYARWVSAQANCQVLYNSGLRPINHSGSKIKIGTLLPGKKDYSDQLEQLLAQQCSVIIECSAADTWHTTEDGMLLLTKLRSQAYRVVIFDGGHHLPTLGLAPDIIIVPEIAGYAAHSYMLDGIKTDKIQELIRVTGSDTLIVSVPRWALIKNDLALGIILRKAVAYAEYKEVPASFQPVARERMSKIKGRVFAWVNEESLVNTERFVNNLKSMGTQDLERIYLAFDYNDISLDQAYSFNINLRQELGVPVENVNEAVKVANAFWSGCNVLP